MGASTASASAVNVRRELTDIFFRLDTSYDFDGWHWQPDTPREEICIGAVLVQHTAWENVERAVERLRAALACSLAAALRLSEEELAKLLRPAGMPLAKARRLRAFALVAKEYGGLDRLLALPRDELRERLLATYGIGPETADAILLYAARHAVFEVDAYTMRLFRRLGLGPERDGYAAWQRWFEETLPPDVSVYRRYHALIVLHSKQTCRSRPRCPDCRLLEICPAGREATAGDFSE